MVIDGFSIISRAFFGTPLLTSTAGVYTNAVHGFAGMLLRLEQDYPVAYLAVAFDLPEPTFRHQSYPDYKATRQKMPPELISQIDLVAELLACWQIPVVSSPGYEADDVLGTLAARFAAQQVETLLVTGDRDSFQLVAPQVKVLYASRSGVRQLDIYDEAKVAAQYGGLTPGQLIDLKALMGDTSDNIPGVPKVGEKTALQLLQSWGSLEAVLANPQSAKLKNVQQNLVTYADQARLSYQLAHIAREVPIACELEDLRRQAPDYKALAAFYQRYQLNQLLSRMPVIEPKERAAPEPLTLFDEVALPSEAASNVAQVEFPWLLSALASKELLALIWRLPKGHPPPWRVAEANLAFAFVGEEPVRARLSREELHLLGRLLQERSFITWRGKELAHLLGVTLARAEDLALMAYLSESGRDPNLGYLAESFLTLTHPDLTQEAPGEPAAQLLQELQQLLALAPFIQKKLEDLALTALYREVELPLSQVLQQMEERGIKVDTGELARLGQEFAREMEQVQQQAYQAVGESFNLNSPKQLGALLFDKLGLPGGKKTKTGYSTDAEVLEELRDKHEVVGLILRYRSLAKLVGTYVEGLIPLVEEDGRLHSTFHQTVVATGRLSSSDPNLQNIPIRQPEGRLLRRAFLPGEPGWLLVSADYSQIELRILAHLSGDLRLIDAYHQGQDIHRRTASEVFGVPLEEVSSAQRNLAKAVNFGVVYGISDYGLGKQLGISRSLAKDFMQRFFERYPGVKTYQEQLVASAREQGFVTTIFHRRRHLPEIHSRNSALRNYAERAALNTPIQGSAADLIKLAMLRLEETLGSRGMKSRMLLQVHDDLLCEAPPEEVELLCELMRQTMEGAISLAVPLKVEIGIGENWYAVK